MWGFHIVLQTHLRGSLPTSEPPYLVANTPKCWEAPVSSREPPMGPWGTLSWPRPSQRL